MDFLGFVFFVECSKKETSHYQAFRNYNTDDVSFVKQRQKIDPIYS